MINMIDELQKKLFLTVVLTSNAHFKMLTRWKISNVSVTALMGM